MIEPLNTAGGESVDSASPITALKTRIVEMAKFGKSSNEPTQNNWRARKVQNGFIMTHKAIFVSEAFALNGETELPDRGSIEYSAGLAVLSRNIYNSETYDSETRDGKKHEPYISYTIRLGGGLKPVILIDKKSILRLKFHRDSGVQISEVEEYLTDNIREDTLYHAEVPSIRLNEAYNKFLQKLLDSLDEKDLELIEADASSNL